MLVARVLLSKPCHKRGSVSWNHPLLPASGCPLAASRYRLVPGGSDSKSDLRSTHMTRTHLQHHAMSPPSWLSDGAWRVSLIIH